MTEESRWYEFDQTKGEFVFTKTENHIFAAYSKVAKRIGDMTRDELIHVIAAGYNERDVLAQACRTALGEQTHLSASTVALLTEAVRLVTPHKGIE